ncbi:hypothetical protein PENTCL1PPCAC_14450, partial [Pristionchus entomophagus]
ISPGVIGLLVNVAVLILLWMKKIRTGWSTYRIGMSVTAMQGEMISLLAALISMAHLFSQKNYILIVYGPLAFLPRIFSDIALFLCLLWIIGIWQLLPAPCLLQYLALCRPYFSDRKRIVLSYSLSVVLLLCSTPHYTTFHTPPWQRPIFDNITRRVHDLDEEDVFYAYGATLFPTPRSKKAVINIAVYAVLPPYFIAYAVFIFCCAKIAKALSSFGIQLSAKTLNMQRSFLRMLLMQKTVRRFIQGLLPLIVISVPIGVFVTALVGGTALDKKTFILTFVAWTVPIVQGTIALFYVNGMGVASSRGSQNPFSLTRRSTVV